MDPTSLTIVSVPSLFCLISWWGRRQDLVLQNLSTLHYPLLRCQDLANKNAGCNIWDLLILKILIIYLKYEYIQVSYILGFPGGASGKEPACQCQRPKRPGFDPSVGKIPWRRVWQPIPVFLPRESHWPRSLAGYSPLSHKESNKPEATWHACMSCILSGNNSPHSNRLSEAASQRWDDQVPSVIGPAQSLKDICLKYTCDHCFNRQRHEAQLTMSWSYRVTIVNFSSVFKAYYYMQLLAPALEFPFLGCFFQL